MVVESLYGYQRKQVHQAIGRLVENPLVRLEYADAVRIALHPYETTRLDFADLLTSEINRANGCGTTATFDRKAAKLKGFTLIR